MRLRFTIRDLFWLVLVVAMGFGWWVDHRRMAPDFERMQKLTLKQLIDERTAAAMQPDQLPADFIKELNKRADSNQLAPF